MSKHHCDVLIIGATPAGAALLYQLARFTDLSSVKLIDARQAEGSAELGGQWTSEGLQYGYIDTLASLSQARAWHRSASMVVNYALRQAEPQSLIGRYPKMVVAQGEEDILWLKERYQAFKPHFPLLEWWEKTDIAELEPFLVLDSDGHWRPEPMAAMGTTTQHTIVNRSALVESMLDNARATYDKTVDVQYGTRAVRVEALSQGYRVLTTSGEIRTRYLVSATGLSGLDLARGLGLGRSIAEVPLAETLFETERLVRGRVHSLRRPESSKAAPYAEPIMDRPGQMRLGLAVPSLTRGGKMPLASFSGNGLDGSLQQLRPLIPSLSASALSEGQMILRPRGILVDTEAGRRVPDGTSLDGDCVRFHLTPANEVTTSLHQAYQDVLSIQAQLGCAVAEVRLKAQLMTDPRTVNRGRVA